MLKTTNKSKEEYYLSDNNKTYKFIIERTNNNSISIKHNNYEKLINDSNIKDFKFPNINNINDAYNFLINKFQSNKIKIKEIQNNLNITLEIIPNNILILPKNKIQNIINTENRITSAKNTAKLNINDNSKDNPEQLKLNNTLIKDSFCAEKYYGFNKIIEKNFVYTMDAFISIDTKIPFIVYIKDKINIIFYSCISNEITSIIKEDHVLIKIINIRHYLYDKKDIILSASFDSNIKLWKTRTLECFLEIENANLNTLIISACLFFDKKQYFIAEVNMYCNIRVFDMNKKMIKEFPKSKRNGQFFESYFSKSTSNNYFLYCGVGFLESYDYNKGILFNNYDKNAKNNKNTYYHFVIYDNGIKVKLIAACNKGLVKETIRIFNFNSAELLSEIENDENDWVKFSFLCLWNNNYLFFVNGKCPLKVIDLEKEKIIKTFPKEAENAIFIKMFHHPIYGKCILSQHKDKTIKLWIKDK